MLLLKLKYLSDAKRKDFKVRIYELPMFHLIYNDRIHVLSGSSWVLYSSAMGILYLISPRGGACLASVRAHLAHLGLRQACLASLWDQIWNYFKNHQIWFIICLLLSNLVYCIWNNLCNTVYYFTISINPSLL